MCSSALSSLVRILVLLVLLSGCAGGPVTTLHAPYFPSRDGVLRYRLPAGWFDATNDSQSTGNAVWLLRNDYGATISVSEVSIDEQGKKELERSGLLGLAQLTLALATNGRSAVVEEPPRLFRLNDREFCSYEFSIPSSGDALRVVLLNTGARVYGVTALASGEKHVTAKDVFAAQEEFVGGLRW